MNISDEAARNLKLWVPIVLVCAGAFANYIHTIDKTDELERRLARVEESGIFEVKGELNAIDHRLRTIESNSEIILKHILEQ